MELEQPIFKGPINYEYTKINTSYNHFLKLY